MFDILIINNCPSFYKINLYNEIAKYKKIFVVFSGISDQVVFKKDFKANFEYVLLNDFQVEQRNKMKDLQALWNIYKEVNPEKVIYGGYTMPEYILLSYLVPQGKNILQTESGIESSTDGIGARVKKILLRRFSLALVSGALHQDVLKKLGYRGKIIITRGVGIINKPLHEKRINNIGKVKFLYVGRLIEIKNIRSLVSVFNKNGRSLTIVGSGPLEEALKDLIAPNITFAGRVANEKLKGVYQQHDVFILPSLVEPWGLVLEEALYFGCALAVSNKVSSIPELVTLPKTGVTFDPGNEDSIFDAVEDIAEKIEYYKNNVHKFSIDEKDSHQISCYLDL